MRISLKIKPVKIPTSHNNQPWLQRIALIDDTQLNKTQDKTFGLYYCSECDIYEPYTYQIAADNSVVKEAHNAWVDFQLKHAHGDGRVALFERKL